MAEELEIELTPKDESLLKYFGEVQSALSVIAKAADEAASKIGKVDVPEEKGETKKTSLWGKAKKAYGAVSAGAGMAMAPFNAVTGAFTMLTSSMEKFVAAANPAASMRLDYAFQDLFATVGEKLVPIMDVATNLLGRFADMVSGFDISGFEELFATVGDAVLSLMEALQPLLQLLINGFIPIIRGLSWVFKTLIGWVTAFINKITFGLFGEQKKNKGRSTAAGSISTMGIDAISNRALVAAGRIGTTDRNYQEEIANNTRITAAQAIRTSNSASEAAARWTMDQLRQESSLAGGLAGGAGGGE